MQLINVLGQLVAEPTLFGSGPSSSATFSQSQKGQPLRHMTLPCGDYVGYWNGKMPNGREAASGVLGQVLMVDGEVGPTRKIFYKK